MELLIINMVSGMLLMSFVGYACYATGYEKGKKDHEDSHRKRVLDLFLKGYQSEIKENNKEFFGTYIEEGLPLNRNLIKEEKENNGKDNNGKDNAI